MTPERDDRLDDLQAAGLRMVLGEQLTDELPDIAAEALASGHDSPWLRRAAGAYAGDDDARQWFGWALEELGYECDVDEQEACWLLVRDIARRTVDGDLPPSSGAHSMCGLSNRVHGEGDLRIFSGLASELEDHPDSWPALHRQIRHEAEALLARSTPRTWVLLKADAGIAWPLWLPDPRRVLEPEALDMSDSLRAELARWLEVFAANVDRVVTRGGERALGQSVFPDRTQATAFVNHGHKLAARLQDELGAHFKVEYYPEPVDPVGGFAC